MSQSSRTYNADALPQQHCTNAHLRELTTSEIWKIIEPLEETLRRVTDGKVQMKASQVRGITKRVEDLQAELDSRIEEEDYKCSIDPFYVHRSDPSHEYFQSLGEVYRHDLGRKSKADCKVGNTPANGFKKVGYDKPVANPKTKIRVEPPRRRQ